ncbi:MAG: ATP-binding protein [Streptococcaceae bacterium]|jgi:predicted AAA+ superfamily ATPase|nr:ATP-binding protein [Streptococcaceae bacterium]
MFQREAFNQLLKHVDNEFVKIITGVRRSGKSYLLLLLNDYLLAQKKQVLYINFEAIEFLNINTADVLMTYIQAHVKLDEKVYFLFDEIQLVKDWERVVNGLRVSYNADIYMTGSNAQMLSGQLSTLLSGRYVTLEVFPLSYLEFLNFKGATTSTPTLWREYRGFGAFPALPSISDETVKSTVLDGIFDTILLKDVAMNQNIKNTELLRRVALYLFDVAGNPVSSKKITDSINDELRRKNESISASTITGILDALTNAYIFYKAQRYDIRGKERLKTLSKYYPVDTGLRNQALGRRDLNRGSQLETIVYLELLRRGYQVFVGKYNDKEIDFVAQRMNETLYVQVALEIPEGSTRETDDLLHLPDNYEKILILDTMPDSAEIDGVKVVNVVEWLLDKR